MNDKIIKYPNPILRKKSEEIKEITDEIKKLAQDMIQVMTEGQGIGLAAPQVGELKRIIVIQAEKGPEVFVNPRIIEKSEEREVGEEGCLSFPGLFLKVKREKEILLTAFNLEGEKIQIRVKGLIARIFQHEIDHLDGILFIDKISFWQKLKLKLKQQLKQPK